MRGVKSFAMLLCATSADGKDAGIEFVKPPPGSQAGDRVYFEGEKFENATPEPLLNPKKKVFETIQPVSQIYSFSRAIALRRPPPAGLLHARHARGSVG